MSDKKIQLVVEKTPDHYDTDRVFFMLGKRQMGNGWRSKETGQINVRNCPMCGKENYAPAEATGYCAFCKFNPNPK